MALTEVQIQALPLERFGPLVGPETAGRLLEAAVAARRLLEGRTVWNVNSTSAGGGVAEMLQPLLAYGRGAGVDTRWIVIGGDPRFFRITKRIHNGLHGMPGDAGPLGDDERSHYQQVLHGNVRELRGMVQPGDIVLLHDPQTAGLVATLRERGAIVIWRSHIGSDRSNELVERAWAFLRPFLEPADAFVFSRREYVPDWIDGRVYVIPPSIDPFAPKNEELDQDTVRAVLAQAGVLHGAVRPVATFTRRDGSPGRVDHWADIVRSGPPPPPDVPLVVQVSRWDRLKDMAGVMEGFARYVDGDGEAHLALVGPDVYGVADDPEGAGILEECIETWWSLPRGTRRRIQLVCLPMEDVEENAIIVNAVQRHAAVVVQKSLAEGFGLTVAEAMWKERPVVASAVGGIQDQIVDGEHGLLLADPADLASFGEAVNRLLDDPAYAAKLARQARQRAVEQFLGSRHLMQYGDIFTELIQARG